MQKRAAIIGAGISGLTTAYYLNKRGWQVEVFERSEHSGGLLSSRQTAHGLVETAANGLLNSSQLEAIASDIGCEFLSTKKVSRKRFIFRDGQARRWPFSIIETLQILLACVKYFFARDSLAPKKFESLRDWGTRVLGRSLSRYSIETAVQGIYAMPADQQSAALTLDRFFKPKLRLTLNQMPAHRPVPPRQRGTRAPRKGLGEFIGKLESTLIARGVTFHFNSAVEARPSSFDVTVVATSAKDASRFLRSIDDPRARFAEKIQMQGLISATVFWPVAARTVEGFGCLFPQDDGHAALGVLLNNYIFEDRVGPDNLSETWILPYQEISDEKVLELIQSDRAKLNTGDMTKTKFAPLEMSVTRWPQALPRYDRELEANIASIPVANGKTYLIGNYMGEIGLKSLIARAKALADQIEREQR